MCIWGARGWGIIWERGAEGYPVKHWLPGNDILIKEKALGGPSISPEWQGECVRVLVHISQLKSCVSVCCRFLRLVVHLHVRLGPSCLFWTCLQRSRQGLWSGGPAAAVELPLSYMYLQEKHQKTIFFLMAYFGTTATLNACSHRNITGPSVICFKYKKLYLSQRGSLRAVYMSIQNDYKRRDRRSTL